MFDFLDADGALADVFRSVALFIPRCLLFAAMLLVGWMIARLARGLSVAVLTRVGFPRMVERSGLSRFLARGSSGTDADRLAARADLDATTLIARLVHCAVLLVTVQLAFSVWGPNPVSGLIGDVLAWLPRAAAAVVIVAVAAALARGARLAVATMLGATTYARPVAGVTWFLVLGMGIVAALNQVGVASSVTTPVLVAVLATVGGILVVGVGGGLIRPMQHRWERILINIETQARTANTSAQAAAYLAGHADATAGPLGTHAAPVTMHHDEHAPSHEHAPSDDHPTSHDHPTTDEHAMTTPGAGQRPTANGWPSLDHGPGRGR
jgi:hypothetical protein